MPVKRSARKRKAAVKSAARLAGKRIDELEDDSASKPEKVRRRRRLLEGPEEFRGFRSDKAPPRKKPAKAKPAK